MLGAVIAITGPGQGPNPSFGGAGQLASRPSFLEMNRKALDIGIKIVQDLNKPFVSFRFSFRHI